MVLLDTNQDKTRPENEAAPRSSELRRGRKKESAGQSASKDENSANGKRPSSLERLIAYRRLKELKKLVEHWREQPDLEKFELPYGLGTGLDLALEERVFRVALPILTRFKSDPTKHGELGPGDIGAFAALWVPHYYLKKGRSPFFDRMTDDYATGRIRKPSKLKADQAGRILGLTLDVRTLLKIRTIGDVGRSAAQRRYDRRKDKAAYKARKRREADMTEWAKSKARTEPWKHFGISRRTWYNRGCPAPDTAPKKGRKRQRITAKTCTSLATNCTEVDPLERRSLSFSRHANCELVDGEAFEASQAVGPTDWPSSTIPDGCYGAGLAPQDAAGLTQGLFF